MTAHESIEVPVLSEKVRELDIPLSLATKIDGTVYVSGTPPLDPLTGKLILGTIEEQTETCLLALQHVLKAAGSDLAKVVMVRIYAANSGHYGRINQIYGKFFTEPYPARTFVPVASWPMPFDLEIECIAKL